MSRCAQFIESASTGVAPAMRAVDCVAGEMTAAAFNRLFGAEGAMAPVLTILLTLYIAFFAISLLTGRSSLGISALTPRMLTLGLVLTFATSWVAYQGVLWNLAIGGPDWIASVLTGSDGSATQIFADRIDIVFAVIGQISEAAGQQGGGAAAAPGGATGMFKAADIMWLGALLLLLGTVGVLLTARIALAVLLALGPVFVVMALFGGTRGLTAGWLRGVVLTAVTPLFVVLAGGITLEMLVPIISSMAASAEGIGGRAAMALFLVSAVHLALMVMVLKVAATIVSGWQVFGLAGDGRSSEPRNSDLAASVLAASQIASPQAGQQISSRRPPVALAPSGHVPVETGLAPDGPGLASERRTLVTHVAGGGIEAMASRGDNRARGIGSRFRNASNDTGRRPAKEMMK